MLVIQSLGSDHIKPDVWLSMMSKCRSLLELGHNCNRACPYLQLHSLRELARLGLGTLKDSCKGAADWYRNWAFFNETKPASPKCAETVALSIAATHLQYPREGCLMTACSW